jgi:hypothetical protein
MPDPNAESTGLRAPPRPRRARSAVEITRTALISLLLGTLIWGYISARRTDERTIDVALELRVPTGWTLERLHAPPTVQVSVRGPQQYTAGLRNEDVRVLRQIRVSDDARDPYTTSLQLEPAHVRGLPQEIEVRQIEPETVEVRLLPLEEQYVPVEVDLQGEPAEGFAVTGVSVSSRSAPILAPKGVVDPDEVIRTRPISIAGRRSPYIGNVRLEPFRKDGESYVPREDVVLVTVEIQPRPVEQVVERVPVRILLTTAMEGLSEAELHPPRVDVTVEGPAARVAELTPGDLTVYVDMRELHSSATGEYTLRAKVMPPGGEVRVRGVSPEEIGWVIPPPPETREVPPEPRPAPPAAPEIAP